MIKKLLKTYKTQLLISLTMAIVLIALALIRSPWFLFVIVLGSLLGTFILDSEYLIYVYILEPTKEFSKNIVAYIKSKDYEKAFDYFNTHRDSIKDKTLNSSFFQIVLAFLIVLIAYSQGNYFVKAVLFSSYANLLYKLAEHYYSNELDEWFWIFKSKFNKKSTIIYSIFILGVLLFGLSVFR